MDFERLALSPGAALTFGQGIRIGLRGASRPVVKAVAELPRNTSNLSPQTKGIQRSSDPCTGLRFGRPQRAHAPLLPTKPCDRLPCSAFFGGLRADCTGWAVTGACFCSVWR